MTRFQLFLQKKKNERNKKYAYLNTTKENTAVNTIIMIKKKR